MKTAENSFKIFIHFIDNIHEKKGFLDIIHDKNPHVESRN